MKSKTYDEFVQKFEQKLTTDDCYTPEPVYAAVLDYVCNAFNVSRETIIRPFYPGGDYQAEDYTGKVVVDNPPFSILAGILKLYRENNIRAFLFCPALVTNSEQLKHWTTLIINAPITYANGARVRTSFVHNFGSDNAFETAPELTAAIKAATPFLGQVKKERPENVITVPDLLTLAKTKNFEMKRAEILGTDRKFYGPGLIVSRETMERLKGDHNGN